MLSHGTGVGAGFGKGIYSADSISLTMNVNKKGFVLFFLCEVALGIFDVRKRSSDFNLFEFCESVLAPGKYYPHEIHIRPDGLKIPNGTLVCRIENI